MAVSKARELVEMCEDKARDFHPETVEQSETGASERGVHQI